MTAATEITHGSMVSIARVISAEAHGCRIFGVHTAPPDRSDQFSTPTLAALQLHDAKNCAGLAASRPWLRFALRPLPGPAGVIGLAF